MHQQIVSKLDETIKCTSKDVYCVEGAGVFVVHIICNIVYMSMIINVAESASNNVRMYAYFTYFNDHSN